MSVSALSFTVHANVGPARASTLTLPHGDVLTPVFMPVGTQVSEDPQEIHIL